MPIPARLMNRNWVEKCLTWYEALRSLAVFVTNFQGNSKAWFDRMGFQLAWPGLDLRVLGLDWPRPWPACSTPNLIRLVPDASQITNAGKTWKNLVVQNDKCLWSAWRPKKFFRCCVKTPVSRTPGLDATFLWATRNVYVAVCDTIKARLYCCFNSTWI